MHNLDLKQTLNLTIGSDIFPCDNFLRYLLTRSRSSYYSRDIFHSNGEAVQLIILMNINKFFSVVKQINKDV